MAILKMKKLRFAAIRSAKDDILHDLIKLGCVQFSELDEELSESEREYFEDRDNGDIYTYREQQSVLLRAVDLLTKTFPVKSKLLAAKPEKDKSEFLDQEGLEDTCSFAAKLVEADDEQRRIAAEESRQRSIITSYTPWKDSDIPLDYEGTQKAAVTLGILPAKVSVPSVETELYKISEETELYRVSSDRTAQYMVFVCSRDVYNEAFECLRGFGFTVSALSGNEGTAAEAIAKAEKKLKELDELKKSCAAFIEKANARRDELKFACDKMSARIALAEADAALLTTGSTVIMEGWVPEENESQVVKILEAHECAWDTTDPEEDEYPVVPVKLKNDKFSNSLNMVTDMYSLPAYGTVDANPYMAPFFILFFGLMMADVGYGILMIIAGIVALKKIKPRGTTLAFCQLLLYCGIATLLMGVLTGGFFSDVVYQLVHVFNPESTWEGFPYLFNPITQSETVLYGALALGAVHLNAGMVVNFFKRKRAGDLKGAIFEEGSLWVVLVGIILFVLDIGNIGGVPVVLIIGLIMLLYGAGRDKKGFGKVTAAFACIYNTASGWFGDVLSYSRIMALMLAGSVIGQVFNTVACMTLNKDNLLTLIPFSLIFLLGHAMNFGLNILGCYVHDLRLQCLEFFGKFFEDGGKAFRPLGIKGKFYNTKEN